MTTEAILRNEALPPSTMLVVHFGVGRSAVDQIIINSIGNYRRYGSVMRDLGMSGVGTLALSVFAARGSTTLGALLRGPGTNRPQFGTATVARLTEAGFDLWPTTILKDGLPLPYSEDHFDIPIPGCDARTADGYLSLTKVDRRVVRDRFRGQFDDLMELFEPRQLSEYAAACT